jgi:hypothetical protein
MGRVQDIKPLQSSTHEIRMHAAEFTGGFSVEYGRSALIAERADQA